MMNKPCENGITGSFDEVVVAMYLAKNHKVGVSSMIPFLPEHGESISKISTKKLQSWIAEVSVRADDRSSQYKNGAVEIKDLLPWVRVIAQKIHRPLPSSVMLNDLIQDGMIGLIMAFREHDADSGIPFHAFAENKIRWAIMDGLRAGDWAGRSVRRRASKVTKTTDKLQALLHRKPLKSEIADALGVHVDDITTTLGDAYGYSFVRIDDSVEGETQDIPDSRMEPSAIVERREVYSRAVASLKILQPNERKAFILRIMCDMSGRQAADEMGLGESRVSQLYKMATEKLASCVQHWNPQEQ
jgi:RNA polymerase sigma factor for flagellar operon FliA